MPFHPLRGTEISCKVIQGDRPAMPSNANALGISDGLRQLLVRCWNADWTKRPRINEVLQHLSQEDALGVVFPPSKPPRPPSCESVIETGTHRYDATGRSNSVYSDAYPSEADIFVTAETPTEGTPDLPHPPMKLTYSSVQLEHVPPLVPANPVDTPIFGDASPSDSFESLKSQSLGLPYNMAGISANAESQPTQELVNDLDMGGYLRHSNQDPG
jgi:hypothetical protein